MVGSEVVFSHSFVSILLLLAVSFVLPKHLKAPGMSVDILQYPVLNQQGTKEEKRGQIKEEKPSRKSKTSPLSFPLHITLPFLKPFPPADGVEEERKTWTRSTER